MSSLGANNFGKSRKIGAKPQVEGDKKVFEYNCFPRVSRRKHRGKYAYCTMLSITRKAAHFRRVNCENMVIYGVLLPAMCSIAYRHSTKTPIYLHVYPFLPLLLCAYSAPGAYSDTRACTRLESPRAGDKGLCVLSRLKDFTREYSENSDNVA